MAETVRSAAEVVALEETTRTGALTLPGENNDPWHEEDGRFNNRVADLLALVAGLEVFKDGALTFGVRAGKFSYQGQTVTYAGATGQALTDNDTNYIYLTAAGALTVNLTGFPTTARVELAEIVTAGSTYAIADITDSRQPFLWKAEGEVVLKTAKIPFQDLRNNDFTVIDATPALGKFSFSDGGFGTGTITVDGQAASGAPAITSTLQFEWTIPADYVADADIRLVVNGRETVGAATAQTTISGEVYESGGDGTVGADLAASWDDTDLDVAGWAEKTLTVTDTTLAPGDKLRIYIRIVTDDTGGAVGTIAAIGEITMKYDAYASF